MSATCSDCGTVTYGYHMCNLRERIVKAMEQVWLERADAQVIASPRQHYEAMADAVLREVRDTRIVS